MSEQEKIDGGLNLEDMSLDELLASAKKDLEDGVHTEDFLEEPSEAPQTPEQEPSPAQPEPFQPQLPPEYADLKTDEEIAEELEALEAEEAALDRVPGIVKVMLYVCCVLAASILLAIGAWKCADEVLSLTAEDHAVTVTVPENATIETVTELLESNGLIEQPWLFKLYCMISNAEEKISPGIYELNAIFDYHALVNGMIATSENRATVMVTIPEGYEAEDIFALLEEKGVCTVPKLKEAAANYDFSSPFIQPLKKGDFRRLEGYLFPDTYEFYVDDNPENVLAKFLRNFNNKISDEFYVALEELNADLEKQMRKGGFTDAEIQENLLTFHEIVIVASLVEKETTRTSESASISSVIYNRLCSKLYPCLNIDSTIQYVLPERKETLTLADKSVVSPYNTYTNAGLPVGPISNPGVNSIRAALYPADTTYYFYALDPGGFNHFSSNYYEHEEYLAKLRGDHDEDNPDEPNEPDTGDSGDGDE